MAAWLQNTMCFTAYPCLLLALLCVWCPSGTQAQDLREHDAICSADGCYAVYFQQKTFRESLRTCRDKGGNLATVKSIEEAELIHRLLSSVDRQSIRPRIRLWIGLLRQPRQCSATRPLRGFTWTTGDQETQYTNWQREDLPNTCTAPRCVVMTYNAADKSGNRNNFKWLDGSCALAVDGFLCRYTYQGMCPVLQSEGGGPVVYSTPFSLLSTSLTHIPFGSVATVPCPEGSKGEQSVLCMLRENTTVGWSNDAPFCSDAPTNWCQQNNGGCQQVCVNADDSYYCECSEGFDLNEDGLTCQPADPCLSAECHHKCEPMSTGFRCTCPNGYVLAPDGKACLDIDECNQTPCPELCINVPGTFECRCQEGYEADEDGECVDVDECQEDVCEQICVNTPGFYECRCADGYSQAPEDPARCQDVDECQTHGICQQLCQNYHGGFACQCSDGFELEQDYYTCRKVLESVQTASIVTSNPTSLSPLPTDLTGSTEMSQEEVKTTQASDWHVQQDESPFSASPSSDREEESVITNIHVQGTNRGSNGAVTLKPQNTEDKMNMSPSPAEPYSESEPRPGTGKRRHDKSWLLVALLVPLCVFIVVMLALGIVYCTSCAVEPRSKGVTDCYRWITTSKPAETTKAKSRA
ncbi:endosialin [Denticeps clupeoides]|uniref:CD248 molecule, endosialin b n=1 Tax=Denticeps clupeoides TaxID=299321 RepID=A0AAY4ALG3_9TELE|nr:endosialin-like [Denticeps clupeoides]